MRVLIASSATGGHIYPALAIADGVKKRDPDTEILFVGARWEIGKGIIESAGYRQEFIDINGFDRKNPFKMVATLAELARASGQIKTILRAFNPDVCVGTGGHVAGPVIRVAKKAGIRTMIQEQNVIPGMANKLAERYADRIFVGFEDTVKYFKDPRKIVVSGNPVRGNFAAAAVRRPEFREKCGIPEDAFCTLLFGGSQGAEAINAAALDVIVRLADTAGYHFILVAGRQLYESVKERLDEIFVNEPQNLIVMDYADAIYELYAASDLIVSRAGALTVTEIIQSRKASILIPSPNVTNNHQYFNAKVLSDVGAAVLLAEEELDSGRLVAEIERLAGDPCGSHAMSANVRKLAEPDAAQVIVDAIFGS